MSSQKLSKFQITGLLVGATAITINYFYQLIKTSAKPKTYEPGCMYSENPANPCVVADIPRPGSYEEKLLVMESLLEIPGIFDAQKSPLPESENFFQKMNPAAKCEPEFELMLCRALFKIFQNKIDAKHRSVFSKQSKQLILAGDFTKLEQEEQANNINSFARFNEFVFRMLEFLGYKDEGINTLEMFERTEANQKW